MAIATGDITANHRFNPITGLEVPETVSAPGEIQTVAEMLPELPGLYGFSLNEVPQPNPPGVISVIRISDSQAFSPVSGAPGALEFKADYGTSPDFKGTANIFFNASEDGEAFYIQYKTLGAPASISNVQKIAALTQPIEGKIKAARLSDLVVAANTTKTIFAKRTNVRNLTIGTGAALIIDSTLQGIGIIEVFGTLTLTTGTSKLKLARCILVTHGPVVGAGQVEPYPLVGANGGNGGNNATPATAAQNNSPENGGLAGSLAGSGDLLFAQSGPGGGGIQNGGTNATAGFPSGTTTPSTAGGIGAGGGGGARESVAAVSTPSSAGGAADIFIGSGGAGGNFTGAGTNAGGGGGSGGNSLIWIAFGDIDPNITVQTGFSGLGGDQIGGATVGSGGQGGSFKLYSKYASSPFASVTLSTNTTFGNARDGTTGTATYTLIDDGKIMGILNELTLNPLFSLQNVNQFGYLWYTKQGNSL